MNVLQIVLAAFAILGALDRITGNHFKIGEEFEKGILSAGSLAMAMIGMIVLAPTLSAILIPVFGPLSNLLHLDPSFVAGFLANDMGGVPLAKELSPDTVWGGFNGLIVASMLGVTVCFTIPVPLRTADKKYHKDILSGILCGIVTMPIGCIAGGLVEGCPPLLLLWNVFPLILISGIVCLGLVLNADLSRKIFSVFGNLVMIVVTIGLAAGVFDYFTGIKLIPHMDSIGTAFESVWGIAVTLAGVFPFIAVVSKVLKKPLSALGGLLKINDTSILGLISSLSNSIPMFAMIEKMDSKGIMMNMAFAVSASFVFGDHLAFTMAFDNTFLDGMIVGKLVGGVCAVAAAHFLYRHAQKKEQAASE
ncbi:MAG: ethanolamine utilization protein EutH [Clostridia bacterium]|nr:ethanolamine utilization protein EutH [Clostridia bacterium]